jgi:flagellar motor switch protein FliM
LGIDMADEDEVETPAEEPDGAVEEEELDVDPSMLLPDDHEDDDPLGQDEIDSLLGLGGGDDTEDSGVLALVNSAAISYERPPLLEVAFDRLVRVLTTSLRNFTGENIELALEETRSIRFGDYLESLPLPAMISVFKAVEWDNYGLITVDSSLIYSIVDVLLGGRRGSSPVSIDGRSFTSVELVLIQRLVQLILVEMANAFEPLSKVEFRHERLETSPRFAAIARPTNAAVIFTIRVDMDDRGGTVTVLIPYATLEPVRDLLLQMFMGEKFGRDPIWETHLAKEILVTETELEAVLDEQMISLGEVLNFKVGTTVQLQARPGDPVVLRCGQVPLMTGRLGRFGEAIAVQVDQKIERGRDKN